MQQQHANYFQHYNISQNAKYESNSHSCLHMRYVTRSDDGRLCQPLCEFPIVRHWKCAKWQTIITIVSQQPTTGQSKRRINRNYLFIFSSFETNRSMFGLVTPWPNRSQAHNSLATHSYNEIIGCAWALIRRNTSASRRARARLRVINDYVYLCIARRQTTQHLNSIDFFRLLFFEFADCAFYAPQFCIIIFVHCAVAELLTAFTHCRQSPNWRLISTSSSSSHSSIVPFCRLANWTGWVTSHVHGAANL